MADPDIVVSAQKTKALLIEKCGGNAGLATDLIVGDKAARELFLRAEAAHQFNERRRLGCQSLPPSYRPL